jgi:hypothetical protein
MIMKSDFYTYIAGVLTAVAAATAGVWLKYHLDNKRSESDNKKLIYQRLMGLKNTITQLEASKAEAELQSNYHEAVMETGQGDVALSKQEAKDKMELAIEYSKSLVKIKDELYQLLANASVSFSSDNVQKTISEIYNVHHLLIKKMPNGKTPEELLTLLNDNVRDIHTRADDLWRKPINKLVNLLKKEFLS